MSVPLSATIRPYVFIARKIFCTSGVNPEMSRLAFSRSRAPIGSAPAWSPPVRGGIDVAVRRPHRHAERVADSPAPNTSS